jgi:hypothetical protein
LSAVSGMILLFFYICVVTLTLEKKISLVQKNR